MATVLVLPLLEREGSECEQWGVATLEMVEELLTRSCSQFPATGLCPTWVRSDSVVLRPCLPQGWGDESRSCPA
jgi:hypothetical protein